MFTERQQQILNALSSAGKTTGDALAATLGVSKRTIYRDLTALIDAGIAVRTEGGPRGGIWLEGAATPSASEADTPAAAVPETSSRVVPTPDESAEQPAPVPEPRESKSSPVDMPRQQPARAATPGESAQFTTSRAGDLAAEMRERVYLDVSGWWQEDAPSQVTVDLLQDAIFANRMMRIRFVDTPDEPTIEPYGLVAKAGVWYLVWRQGSDFIADRLARIQSAEIMDRGFERQSSFNLAAWWNESSNQFVLRNELYRFVALVRRSRIEFLRLYVGGGLQTDPFDAQSVRARFEVASPEAAVMIVLGLGQDAVVIEPEDLPLMVRRAAAGRPIHDSGVAPASTLHMPPAPPVKPVAATPARAPVYSEPVATPARAHGPELFPSAPVGTIVHG